MGLGFRVGPEKILLARVLYEGPRARRGVLERPGCRGVREDLFESMIPRSDVGSLQVRSPTMTGQNHFHVQAGLPKALVVSAPSRCTSWPGECRFGIDRGETRGPLAILGSPCALSLSRKPSIWLLEETRIRSVLPGGVP